MIIQFTNILNVSIQPTDILYASKPINNQSGTNHPTAMANTKPIAVGVVIMVDHDNMTIEIDTVGFTPFDPNQGWYYFFGKNRRANLSGILGYYMAVEYRNSSKKEAEMFATGVEFVESSK